MTETAPSRRASVRPTFECGVVAVLAGDLPVGTGMLVDARHVITCAHVWQDAAGPQGADPVHVQFPFADRAVRPASIVAERPVGPQYGDVAVLRIDGEPPAGASPVRLVLPGSVAGHRFEVWGFPRARAGEQFAHGRLSRRRGDDLIQLEGERSTGLAIGPGYSGAPVWDAELSAVIGIVASVDPDPLAKTGYLIPVDVVLRAWPTLRIDDTVAAPPVPQPMVGPAGRVIGLRPAGSLEHWHNREELRERLADLITGGHRVISVVGRRGVGKSGVVTKVASDMVEGREPGHPRLDGVIYLSTRTGTAELGLDRIFHETSNLLAESEQIRLAHRFAAARTAALPELFQSLDGRSVLIVLDNVDDLQDPHTGAFLASDVPMFLRAVALAPAAPCVVTTSQRALRFDVESSVALVHLEVHDGLDPDDAVSLLRQMDVDGRAGTRSMDDMALRTLAERVGGVPRGLQLVIAHLRDHPMSGRRRLLRADAAPDELLRQLVSDAFDDLSGATRNAVETIAVAGVPMSIEALVAVNECPPDEVEDALDELVARQELICGDDDLLRLHPLDTDYVRSRLSPERHAELDLRLADWFAANSSDRAGWRRLSDADPVKKEYWHRLRGGEPEKGLEALADAAEFIARHGDAEFLRAAVRRAGDHGLAESGAADICRAFTEFFAGDLKEALRCFRRRSHGAGPVDEWEMWTGVSLRYLHRIRDAVAMLAPLAANPATPRLLRFEAAFELGLAHCYEGDAPAAARVVELLAELQQHDDPAVMRARYHDIVALHALITGRPQEAIAAAEESAAHYAGTFEADAASYVHNVHGVALLVLGEWEEALGPLSTAASSAAAVGHDRPESLARTNLAWAYSYLGRWRDAEESAQLAAHKLDACGEPGSAALLQLARAVRSSDAGEARERLERAVEELRPNPDVHHPSPAQIMGLAAARAADR